MLNDKYDLVVGLEIHAELNSKTKVFCSCENKYGAEPNTLVCPICLGMPGTIPLLNKQCVLLAVKAGLMTNCEINEHTFWERKNYFYPDLTKSYQISQVTKPVCVNGYIELDSGKKIRISDIHLEEDTGKLIHDGAYSYIDYNRCCVPLIETVTEPDISTAEEAVEFLMKLRDTYIYGDVAKCKLEQGGMRFDVNLSVKPKGSTTLGKRVEMKNLNSFKSVKNAIEYEFNRHVELLESGQIVDEETRKWDDSKNMSFAMRKKDPVSPFRVFPDPDIPAVHIKHEIVEDIKENLPLTPMQLKSKYKNEYNLPDYDIKVLTSTKELSDFYNACLKIYNNPKELSNWVMGELLRNVKDKITISPEKFIEVIKMTKENKISRINAVEVIARLMITDANPMDIAKELNLLNEAMSEEELEKLIVGIINSNPKAVEDYQKTPDKIISFLAGQLMKLTHGKADIIKGKEIIETHLKN